MRFVTGATARSNIVNLYEDTCWKSFLERRDEALVIMIFKIKSGKVPNYLQQLLPKEVDEINAHNLRNKKDVRILACRTETFKR